ncbi:MAG: hypothetical protein LBR39_03820 [Coriobacteriales bacterium]|nr:hypothetical protein [Coriobacteriales bacterium]
MRTEIVEAASIGIPEDGRTFLKVNLNAEEVQGYLSEIADFMPKAHKLEGVAAGDITAILADADSHGQANSYLMKLAGEQAMKQADLRPITKLVYLARGLVQPGAEFEFIISLVPAAVVELSSYEQVDIRPAEVSVSDREVNDYIRELIKDKRNIYLKGEDAQVAADDIIEIKTYAVHDNEVYEPLTADKRVYKVGEAFMPEEFDQALLGMKMDESKTFTIRVKTADEIETFARYADEDPAIISEKIKETVHEIDVTITVWVLRIFEESEFIINDEWVRKNYPSYSSVDAIKERFRNEIYGIKAEEAFAEAVDAVLDAVTLRVTTVVPDGIYALKFGDAYRAFCNDLKDNKQMNVEEFCSEEGITELELKAEMEEEIRKATLQGFALDAYARHHGITVTEADIKEALEKVDKITRDIVFLEHQRNGDLYILEELALRNVAVKHLMGL